MQEDIENRTVALIMSVGRFTYRTLARGCSMALRDMRRQRQRQRGHRLPPKRETVKDLMKKREAPSVPFKGATRQFDRFARKYNVDYQFKKLAPGKYLLFFKAAQADNIKDCLADYANSVMNRGKPSPRITFNAAPASAIAAREINHAK